MADGTLKIEVSREKLSDIQDMVDKYAEMAVTGFLEAPEFVLDEIDAIGEAVARGDFLKATEL